MAVVCCNSQLTTHSPRERAARREEHPPTMSALDELSQALTSLTTTIAPSVVGIGSRLRGSGVVSADGQVLTNAHNVRGDEVTVTFAGGRTAPGTVAGIDVDGDLAVISVDTAGATPIG